MVESYCRHLRQSFRVGALILLTAAPFGEDAQSQRSRVPRLEPSACMFPGGPVLAGSTVECSWLVVPENRGRADSREIRLAVAVLRARKPSGAVPLVMLHGGPGGSGLLPYPVRAARAGWGNEQRDVVIYDQRAAGLSEPKLCPEYSKAIEEARILPSRETQEDRLNRGAHECIASLKTQGADPEAYSTITNALDLIDLRKALGYRRWDVFSESYGTKVAQEAMVRDGGAIRAVSLLWPLMRASSQTVNPGNPAQSVMEHVFARCAGQETCRAAFPDSRADFFAAFDDLTTNPISVPRGDSTTETIRIDGPVLVQIIRNHMLRRPGRVSQLPLLLHELHAGDRLRAARTLGSFVAPPDAASPEDVLVPLIRCFDVYDPRAVAVHDEGTRRLPAPYRDEIWRECPQWRSRFAEAADRTPVRSDIPTLLLSAEFDDRTPTENAQRIAATLPRAHIIELPNIGHGSVLPAMAPCVNSVIAGFFDNPFASPDDSCVAQIPRLQFVTGWRNAGSASSVVSSVIALAESANTGKQTKAAFAGFGGFGWATLSFSESDK